MFIITGEVIVFLFLFNVEIERIDATNVKVLIELSIWLTYQLKADINYHIHKYVSMRI
ncbi:MAG: hypothetical protein ACR5KW_00250 [Wolbachia sp.]